PKFVAPRLQSPGLRQVQIPGAEKSSGSPQEAESRRGQGDQTPADDRRPRLRRENALDEAIFRRGRQGQDYLALSRTRNGAPGARLQAARTRESRHGLVRQDRVGTAVRRPADGHDAGTTVAPQDNLKA